MMKIFFTLSTAFVFVGLLSGCQKKIDAFIPDTSASGPDTTWHAALTADLPVVSLKNDLQAITAADSFAYNNTGIVFNSGNYSLTIPPNALVSASGSVPAGNVVRQSLLLQKKGDFIAQSLPTTSENRLLLSGGEFFLGLANNGTALQVAAGDSLTVKYSSSNILPATKVYNLTGDIVSGFSWVLTADPAFNKVNPLSSGYEVVLNRLQWVQPAVLFDTTGIPETLFSLKLPANYTNGNTVAYISFNDLQCVAGLTGNTVAKTFISGLLPVGKPITIVVISKQAGDYYLGSQQTTTALPSSGSGTQEILLTPMKSSMAVIKSYLANL